MQIQDSNEQYVQPNVNEDDKEDEDEDEESN